MDTNINNKNYFRVIFGITIFLLFVNSVTAIQYYDERAFINDSRAYIDVPNIITSNAYQDFYVMSKNSAVTVNMVFMVDDDIKPYDGIEVLKERTVTSDFSLSCPTNEYEAINGIAYCYRTSENGTVTLWSHYFDSFDVPSKTIFWSVNDTVESYERVQQKPYKIPEFYFRGLDRGYLFTNINLKQNDLLSWRTRFDVPIGANAEYGIGFYPSSYGTTKSGIQQAISDDKYYWIHPFINRTNYEIGNLSNSSNYWDSDINTSASSISLFGNGSSFQAGKLQDFTDGLRGFWTMDDADQSENDVSDSTGNGHTAVSTGVACSQVTAILGESCKYNNANNTFHTISNYEDYPNDQFTLNFWMREESGLGDLTQKNAVGVRDGNTLLFIAPGSWSAGEGYIRFRDSDSVQLSPDWYINADTVQNGWNMMTLVANSTNVSLYVNGVLDTSRQNTFTGVIEMDSWALGYDPLPREYFDGYLDEIGVWNKSFTSKEVKTLYNAGSPDAYPFNNLGDYNTSAIDYRSNRIPMVDKNSKIIANWTYKGTGGVIVNVSCDSNESSPNWYVLTNNTETSCSIGDSFSYHIRLTGVTSGNSPLMNTFEASFIANTNPNVTQPNITPSSPTVLDNLTAQIKFNDSEGDNGTVYFYWYKNGNSVFNDSFTALNNEVVNSLLGFGNTSTGDNISVYVNATDVKGGVALGKQSINYSIAGIPPPGVTDLTNISRTKTSLFFNWTNPPVAGFWNYTELWINGTNADNTSNASYNFTGLTVETTYQVILYTVGDDGTRNNTAVSFVWNTKANEGAVITPNNPANPVTLQENTTTQFNITATDDDGGNLFVNWLKDGVSQLVETIVSGLTSAWNWATGFQDSGFYNVTVEVNDTFNTTTSYSWVVTVDDTFPLPKNPLRVYPDGGSYEYDIPLLCEIDYKPIQPYFFNWYYSINGSAYVDMNRNETKPYLIFDFNPYSVGTNISFGCRVSNDAGNSNITYSDTFTRINKNNFFVEMNTKNIYSGKVFPVRYVMEIENDYNVSIASAVVDCNGNGKTDYFHDYRDYNVTQVSKSVNCIAPIGERAVTVGMVLFKNNSVSWDLFSCNGLSNSDNYCIIYKTYEIEVKL